MSVIRNVTGISTMENHGSLNKASSYIWNFLNDRDQPHFVKYTLYIFFHAFFEETQGHLLGRLYREGKKI